MTEYNKASVRAAARAAEGQLKRKKQRTKLGKFLVIFIVGFMMVRLPKPDAVSAEGWRMLAIFATTILAIALEPLPAGAVAIVSFTIAVVTKTVAFADALEGFTNDVTWMVVIVFFLARAFEKTRLATRLALILVRAFGSTTLGLAYGVILTEVLLGLAMPSSTARAAGVLYPLISAMAVEAGDADIGGFLLLSTFQANSHSSALWVTAAATNYLSLDLAKPWWSPDGSLFLEWLVPACVPAVFGIVMSPVLAEALCPPKRRSIPELPKQAAAKLRGMGPMATDEKVLFAIVATMVYLWSATAIRPVITGLMGLSALLLAEIVDWKDCIEDKKVWDIVVWFSLLVGLSAQLNRLGVIEWFGKTAGGAIAGLGLTWQAEFTALSLLYYYTHYFFASQVAHISALMQPVMAILVAAGCPAKLATLCLAYLGNISASLTNYSSAHAPVFYMSGYFSLRKWWKVNFVFSVANMGVWLMLGQMWWYMTGLASGEDNELMTTTG